MAAFSSAGSPQFFTPKFTLFTSCQDLPFFSKNSKTWFYQLQVLGHSSHHMGLNGSLTSSNGSQRVTHLIKWVLMLYWTKPVERGRSCKHSPRHLPSMPLSAAIAASRAWMALWGWFRDNQNRHKRWGLNRLTSVDSVINNDMFHTFTTKVQNLENESENLPSTKMSFKIYPTHSFDLSALLAVSLKYVYSSTQSLTCTISLDC